MHREGRYGERQAGVGIFPPTSYVHLGYKVGFAVRCVAYSSEQMTITSSRKPDKLCGRLSSEVEHWDANPKVRGSIPRVSRIYRVKRMIDIIKC